MNGNITESQTAPLKPIEQVKGAGHYAAKYLGPGFERLASYREQLVYTLKSSPKKVLLVGAGDGFVVRTLRQSNVNLKVVDIDQNLNPDIQASVEELPIPDKSFDVTVCCEVLEHLPFDRFAPCLRELRRVTRDRLVLSFPDNRRFFCLRLRFARFKFHWQASLPRISSPVMPRSRLEEEGHHWEVGYKGFGMPRVKQTIQQARWRVIECKRVPDMAWHCFLYLEPLT